MNKKLLSRLVFLGIIAVVVLAVFWMGQTLSKSQKVAPGGLVQDFVPAEKGTAMLVEFSDFQCPACGMYYPLVKQLKAEYGDKLNVVYKHFPLRQIHKNAELAARASEAALNQGKFQEMHNILFEKQTEWSTSGQAMSLFTAYADALSLDRNRFIDDIGTTSAYDKVNSDYQQGVRLGVTGTPTFYLNGKKLTNPRNYDEFSALIKQAIEQ